MRLSRRESAAALARQTRVSVSVADMEIRKSRRFWGLRRREASEISLLDLLGDTCIFLQKRWENEKESRCNSVFKHFL